MTRSNEVAKHQRLYINFPRRSRESYVNPKRATGANGVTMMIVVLERIFATAERNPGITDPEKIAQLARYKPPTVKSAFDNFIHVQGNFLPKPPQIKS